MTTIIALAGAAGAGKDETAQIMMAQLLRREPMVRIRTLSFAAPIKEAVAAILNCSVEDFEDREFKESNLLESHNLDTSPRIMMQLLGSEFGRNMIDDQIWIKTAQARFDAAKADGVGYMFITDLRYENEHKWVLENGGVVIYVDRQQAAPVAAHSSEAGLSRPPCYVIDNNGTINALRKEAYELVCLFQPVPLQKVSIDQCTPSEWDAVTRKYL